MPVLVSENKPRGRKARDARKWFADNGPPDAQPLPLGYNERERLKHGGVDHIVAWFARSLDCRNYDVLAHPAFEDYARGVMASEFAPEFVTEDEELKKRFPPRPLDGMGPGLCWLPPMEHTEAMESVRRCRLPPEEYAKAVASLRRSRGLAA
jgi:hypothetical protein